MSRWPCGVPSPETVAACEAMLKATDKVKPNSLANIADGADRAQGYIAEALLDRWLTIQGVEHEWDGGPNPNPDFVVKGKEVAVRTTATKKYALDDDQLIYIFEAHARGTRHRFFVGIDKRAPTAVYYLLGGTTLEEFLDLAQRFEPGETVCRGFIARHPMYVGKVGMLTPPAEWVASL